MSTASSVLSGRIATALRAAAVAVQAGVDSAAWASLSAPRVFRGLGGYLGGRNRGRLPFMEYEIETQTFSPETERGGELSQHVRLRCHVGGADPGVAGELCEAILCEALASIRSETGDNLTALGGDAIEAPALGPWGTSRDASLVVIQSFERSDYEVQ